MHAQLRIDFVSDVSCPWCAIGLKSLEAALDQVKVQVQADIHFQPFELNPNMSPEGQDLREHLVAKYGLTPEQYRQNTEVLRLRGEQVGIIFTDQRSRIYNTFDAHRLLHWADLEGRQRELQRALFQAYFIDGQNPSSHETLLDLAVQARLDTARARGILASDEYAQAVRERERFYLEQGIHAVPSVIINERHLIQGGQPAEVFAHTLRKIAAEQTSGEISLQK